MDFWRAVEVLGKRKWLLLLSTVLSAGLTFGATQLIGSRWMASVRFASSPASSLMAAPGSQENVGADVQIARLEAPMYEAMFRTRDVLEPALRELSLMRAPEDLLGNIKVDAIGPRLFELRVMDSSATRAMLLANALLDSFVTKNRTLYTQQAEKVVNLLEEQLRTTDAQLNEARKRYEDYRKEHDIVSKLEDHVGPVLYRLQVVQERRDDVLEELAQARARLREAQSRMATLPKKAPVERPGEVSLLVQQLEEELAQRERELTTLRARYTDEKLEVRQALAVRNAVRDRLKAELAKEPERIAMGPNPARARLRQTIEELEEQVRGYEAQEKTLDTMIGAAQAEISRFTGVDGPLGTLAAETSMLMEARSSLKERLQTAQMALDAAERQNPIVIVDRASDFNPPVNTTPGRTKKLTVLAALCALFGTAGAVFALESVDRRLRTVREAEQALPTPVIAAIPQPSGAVTRTTLARAAELYPLSLHAEAYRFLGLHLLNARGRPIRSLMVLSAKAEQGSTSTVTNLGITLAQAGQRVIIVDANVRAARVHEVFGLSNDVGFTSLLHRPDSATLEQSLRATPIPNLRVVTSGPPSANPWELFRSSNLAEVAQRLRDLADYVLYDTPSALAFTDALNLAPAVDAAFLCVRALEPISGAEQRLVELLEQANVTVLGSVVDNMAAANLDSYQNYQRYYPSTASTVPAIASLGDGAAPVASAVES
ncbi:MAG: polysaccharide biosynthesis tyrosine autokinase [Armatimonadetes bacterium]|nr:polysaccharide biosynthesis tyrosine autokinase [Armatimonadota bacterium]